MDPDNLHTLFSLFSQRRFHIPDYQRGYAWGNEQWQDIIDDLATLTDDNDHFTGLLVLHENKDPNLRLRSRGSIKDVFDIVDGQQRLTTIVILLNEIRREMIDINTSDSLEIAEDIQQVYLYEPGAGNILVFKLVLDRNNHDYFTRNILGADSQEIRGPQIQSHYNLLGARDFFHTELRRQCDKLKGDYPVWLESFYDKINTKLKVMVYRLRSEADAGVVFESMNSRGKKPNQLDLVKNYLLFLASKLEPELRLQRSLEINNAWTLIFQQLNAAGRSDGEDTLLEMHWATVYNHDRKVWASKKEKSDHVKGLFKAMVVQPALHAQMAEDLDRYVQTLKNSAVAYADIYNPGHSNAFQIYSTQAEERKQIIRSSHKLLRMGILRPFIPLLVAVRLRFPEDAHKYLDIVQLCEKYSFRVYSIANQKTTSGETVLFRYANQLFSGKMAFDTVQQEMRRDLLARCPDMLLMGSFNPNDPNPWYGKRGLTYFLYEFEEELFKQGEPIINWQTVYGGGQKSIEHILPVHPEQDGYWSKLFTNEERQRLTDQIGNLTLILATWNSSLGNKSFQEKKGDLGQAEPCYATSDLKITKQLASLPDWTPAAIGDRQKRLAEWSQIRWYVEAPPQMPDDLFEALKQRAQVNGMGDAFDRIHDLARQLKLPPKANKNRMSYKSPRNNQWSVFKIYTYASGIEFSINFWAFPRYEHVTDDRIREIFANQDYWWLPPDKVADFIERLEHLVNVVEGQGG